MVGIKGHWDKRKARRKGRPGEKGRSREKEGQDKRKVGKKG